jgi:glycosyltransferase involved in cell wall biosynthesis
MAETRAPRVSVCMPVYNGAAYIAEAVRSVLGQTYGDLELLINDNCSRDGTADIIHRFDDARVRYERNEANLGPVANVNRCLARARGEYIGILHHDDAMLPENLERKVRVLDAHPSVGFVHSNMVLVSSAGTTVRDGSWSHEARQDSLENGLIAFGRFLDQMPLGSSIFIGTVLARRSCYDRLGPFATELPHCNDAEMLMRMLLFYDMACLGEPLVRYRVHPASASSAFGDYSSIAYVQEHYAAVQMLFERFPERIPEANALRRRVNEAFAMRALGLASVAFARGERDLGHECLATAKRMLPRVWTRACFWRATVRGLLGQRLARLLRARRGPAAGGQAFDPLEQGDGT